MYQFFSSYLLYEHQYIDIEIDYKLTAQIHQPFSFPTGDKIVSKMKFVQIFILVVFLSKF